MDAKECITPKVFEQYCLGLLLPETAKEVERLAMLHPSIKQDIDHFIDGLEQRLRSERVELPKELKDKTLNLLHNLKVEEEGGLSEQPVLNKHSNYENWLRLVKPLLPDGLTQPMFVHEIRNEEHLSQILIWTTVDYPDEVHTNEQESFIILGGRCRCFIDGEALELGPGDFLEIPMHKHHDVQVLQAPVLAVIQRIKVA